MRSSLGFLLVCISVLLATKPADGRTVENVTAVLGKSVLLRCPGNLPVERLYIQKNTESGVEFINGFEKEADLQVYTKYKNRTTIHKEDLSMEMRNISVSDEGQYDCVLFKKRDEKEHRQINLRVIGEYNTPKLVAVCSDAASGQRLCQLTCSAAGGYPKSVLKWPELDPNLMSNIHNNNFQDQNSKTWTINQTLSYPCMAPTNMSCSIEGTTSNSLTICKADDEDFRLDLAMISAMAVVLIIILIFLAVCIAQKCCGRRRPFPGAVEVPLADCHSQLQDR